MAEEGMVQQFSLRKMNGQRVIIQIDEGKVNYIRKGDVKHTCSIKELAVTDKKDLQIEVMIGSLKKILSAENSEVKEDILKNIFAIMEENAPKQNHSLRPGTRIIKEGFLMKKGNAAFEKWARRKVCIKQGVLVYYPEGSEKTVNLQPVAECHVEASGVDKFNVTVPGRTYSFQIPESVRNKEEERGDWIRCIRLATVDRQTTRADSVRVLPDVVRGRGSKRISKSPTIKQGFLEKQGNAAIKVWNERFVKVEPGKFSYAPPEKKENTLNVVYLHESEVSVITTKNYGFDVQVPGRIFHFRIKANEENKEDEYQSWMEVFKKACCLKRSSESIDVEKVNEITETSFTEKQY
ncbi:uncharacterized protein LOC111125830 isoform X2 [Crassostrea virginica]